MFRKFLALSTLAAASGTSPLPFTLNQALGEHMVLQRAPVQSTIWGTAAPGSKVSVAVGGTLSGSAVATELGNWEVLLSAFEAGSHGDINVTSMQGSIVLTNVLFGDVFLCSGQSNMVFSLSQEYNASQHIADANDTKYRSIRLFTAAPEGSSEPVDKIAIEQPWSVASSETVAKDKDFSYFSAVCWHTGKSIHDSLDNKVPVGLVTSAYGGTRVHQWSSQEALTQCDQSASLNLLSSSDSVHWNAMIVPILKMRFSGIFWLQGESDVNPSDDPDMAQAQRGAKYYACQIVEMVKDWRLHFRVPNLPFMWVQLSPWVGHEAVTSDLQLPAIRNAQLALQSLPQTGYASAVDLGDIDPSNNPNGAVHWRNKAPVGTRLQKVAANLVYGERALWEGPQPVEVAGSCSFAEDETPQFDVTVRFESVGRGLEMRPSLCPFLGGPSKDSKNAKKCGWWDFVAMDGSIFNATTAVIFDDSVVLSSEFLANTSIVQVRYLWADWPVASLYNSEGLPATPFRLNVSTHGCAETYV